MTRLIIPAIVVLLVSGPAWAEEVLYCTDTDVNGFMWENGKAKPSTFNGTRFTVKVISETQRFIKWKGFTEPIDYTCRKEKGQSGTRSHCNASLGIIYWPIIFNGNTYVRSYLFGEHIGGGKNAFVAYGTCAKF